jgi:hypothetical protein
MARNATRGQLINLVIPGGGLILIGSETIGVLVALLFTVAANYAIAALLLIPDEVPATWRGLSLGVAIGTYLGAQIRYAQTVRHGRASAAREQRGAALRAARGALLAGRVEDAWRAIQPLAEQAESDLVVAYRLAQVLTAREGSAAALAAWRRVRRLDRHRIYRQEVAENERTLSGLLEAAGRAGATDSPDA